MPDASKTIIHDPKRLDALRRCCLIDTESEAAFDRLTRLSTRILGAPVSLVSLVDSDRQFFKSAVGLEIKETPLTHSFCQHVVATGEPLIIDDAREHPLVQDNLAIPDLNVIGYLGMPLSTADGYEIGSLCVIDSEPRHWTPDEIDVVQDLAASVMMEIDLRAKMLMQEEIGRDLSDTAIYGDMQRATQEFGIYRVNERIGKGGMAEVFLCEHQVLGLPVAVKQLLAEHSNSASFRKRFQREAEIIASLKHPNIIRVFDFGMKQDRAYMVMEYIKGQTLYDLIHECGQLTLEEALPILEGIADALDHAHDNEVIHRDAKPSNVMLRERLIEGQPTGEYHAILMDFGIARMTQQASDLTRETAIGTLGYAPPEQIRSEDEITYLADIYSLGVVAYEMLTGRLPFESNSPANVIYGHLEKSPPDPRDFNPMLSPIAVEALENAMMKVPDRRPQSGKEFIKRLAAAL